MNTGPAFRKRCNSGFNFFWVCFATVLISHSLLAGILATNLRCGSWENPLGIDEAAPRLSWQLQAATPGERGESQTALQILVATSTNTLASDLGDLWNSGKTNSDSPNISYGGAAIVAEQQVFWKVRVWDLSAAGFL